MATKKVDAPKQYFLIIDEKSICDSISKILKKNFPSATIFTAQDGLTGYKKIKNQTPHLLIVDINMEKLKIEELLERIRSSRVFADLPIILMGPNPKEDMEVQQCLKYNTIYLKKPFKASFLIGIANGIFSKKVPNFKSITLRPGQTLFRDGDASTAIYLVKKGSLKVYKETNGKSSALGLIKENQLVGEMAFMDKKPRSASVQAIEESELIELPLTEFEAYIASQPTWLKAMLQTLLDRLRKANRTIQEMSK